MLLSEVRHNQPVSLYTTANTPSLVHDEATNVPCRSLDSYTVCANQCEHGSITSPSFSLVNPKTECLHNCDKCFHDCDWPEAPKTDWPKTLVLSNSRKRVQSS